jgi:SAM-dependent methyltransferase
VIIELGCGHSKTAGAIGVDVDTTGSADIVGDAHDVLDRFPASSVDELRAFHFLEHVDDLHGLLVRVVRALKPGAKLLVSVPHFSNPYFYSDPTHRRTFGLYSFSYFAAGQVLSRRVPAYCQIEGLRLNSARLIFKSSRPFVVRHALKHFVGMVFDSCRYLREFYEENICFLFPCYEVRFELERSNYGMDEVMARRPQA